jgi:tetratricopeptide (TPR) repeat protein
MGKNITTYWKTTMNFNYIKKSTYIMSLMLGFWLFSAQSIGIAASKTLIILPFINDGSNSHTWLAAGITDYLERAIRTNSAYGVIPLKDVNIISGYLGIVNNRPLPPETIARMTRLSGADEAVSIRYFVAEDRLTISIEMINSTDSEVKKSFSFCESIKRVNEIQELMYRGIVMNEKPVIKPLVPVKVKVKGKWIWIQPKTPNLEYYECYARGIETSETDPDYALSQFVKTLRYDPENLSALVAAAHIVHERQGNIDGALGYLLRADKISVKRGESSTSRYASLMVMIADIYEHKKDHIRSQTFINRAFDFWKKRKNAFPEEYASFLSDIGSMYVHNGDLITGVDYYSMACEACEKNETSSRLRCAWVLSCMGDTYLSLSNPPAAAECFERGQKIFKDLSLDNTCDFAVIVFKKGKALFSLGHLEEAADAFDDVQKLSLALGRNDIARQAVLARQEMTRPLKKNERD